MEDLNVVDSINNAGSWLVRNQELLLSYAVNIVAAIAIIIVGMIVARIVSNTVNRLMLARKIDATVADFLCAGALRYYRFHADCRSGPRGVQTAGDRRSRCRRFSRRSGAARFAVQPRRRCLLVMFRPFRAGEYVDLAA
jgi:small conductance mechanosensitive channel